MKGTVLFLDESDWSNPRKQGEAYDRHGDSDEVLLLLADAVVDAEGTNNSGIQVVLKTQTEDTLAR